MTMEEHTRREIAVGGFVLVGLTALGLLTLSVSGLALRPKQRYSLVARFASVGDLKRGAAVKIAGVNVGRVGAIKLTQLQAETRLEIDRGVAVPADSIASIRTSGLLGEAYVALLPGGSEKDLAPEARVAQTEPALDIVDLIRRYVFGGSAKETKRGEPPLLE